MILSIESATPYGSVALVTRGEVVREAVLPAGMQASATYLSSIASLFPPGGPYPREVECVAVSAGPGSFTGLRVGMAAAKGFCFGWGIPLVRVPTLLALAYRFPGEGRTVCPVLDARKGEVYAAFFRWEGRTLARRTPDMALPPGAVPDRAPEGEILLCGDAVGPFGSLFRERLGARARLVEGPDGLPRAGAVGLLGEASFRGGAAEEPRSAIPRYLRTSEAELARAGNVPDGGEIAEFRAGPASRRRPAAPGPLIRRAASGIMENLFQNHVSEVPMGQSQDEKMAALIARDPEFKALVEEHRLLDEKLKDLDRKVYLLPDEEVERKRLQKIKLAKKDKIAQILSVSA